MSIILNYLISDVTLSRKTTTKTDSADLEIVYTDVLTFKARITRNKYKYIANTKSEIGDNEMSTHIIFAPSNIAVIQGDYIIDDSENRYYVNFVNTMPGGVSGHHLEIYCTLIDGVT